MEVPFTKEQILALIERHFESTKVDYKREYSVKDPECVKDILAMANTIDPDETLAAVGLDPGLGFILIGCDEKGERYDISALDLDDADLQQVVNERVEPKIRFLFVPFAAEGAAPSFGAIVVWPSQCPPHILTRQFHQFRAGSIFVRRGTSTSEAVSPAELDRMWAYRAHFSEKERRLQREEFKVSEAELRRLAHIYVEPCAPALPRARQTLQQHRFLLIHGEMGVGKRSAALSLARGLLEEGAAFRLLRVSRFTPIGEVGDAEGAAILIPDAFGLFQLEREEVERDIALIEELTSKNLVLMTSSTAVLNQALAETRLAEWDLLRDAQWHLVADGYDSAARREIMSRHLSWATNEGRVAPEKDEWVRRALRSEAAGLREALDCLRLPLDIKRFVDDRLPRIETADQLRPALRELGSLQREITAWFHSLEQSQQCFLLTLALFDGFEPAEIWAWHSRIGKKLRDLNPALAILPLGVIADSLAPYVVQVGGAPTFAHPSFHKATLAVIAEKYREYFLHLIPDFVQAAVPAADASSDDEIDRTRPVREAVALVAGEMAKGGVRELLGLVEGWGSHRRGRVCLAAAEVLCRAAESPSQLEAVLKILGDWTADKDKERWPRRWTAAVTYGRLAATAPGQASSGLSTLAKDEHPFVRSGVPKALRPVTAILPEKAREILTALAANSNEHNRRAVAKELRTLSYRNLDFVVEMLRSWATLKSRWRIWTLARTCLIASRVPRPERLTLLGKCVGSEPESARGALRDALKETDIPPDVAWSLLEGLAEQEAQALPFLPPLVSVLEESAAEPAWERVKSWAAHTNPALRAAAAYILVAWKERRPDLAQALLVQLAADPAAEVASAAQSSPVLVIQPGSLEEPANQEPVLRICEADLPGLIRILGDTSPADRPGPGQPSETVTPSAPGSAADGQAQHLADRIHVLDKKDETASGFEIRILKP